MPTPLWNIRAWTSNLATWSENPVGHHYGDQWGDPEELPALAAVRDRFARPFAAPERTALEIGPGGGRWTQYLLPCARVVCVDLNPEMFPTIRQRFPDADHLEFVQTSGTDLPGVAEASVDLVFSFGTFVHLDPELVDGYLASVVPTLRPGADVVIQYPEKRKRRARENPGFALNTAPLMAGLLRRHGLTVLQHDEDTLDHSNVVHARRDPAAPPALALATAAPYRFLAWPRYEPDALIELFAGHGRVLADRRHVALCLRVGPGDPEPDEIGRRLSLAWGRTLGDDAALDVLLVDDRVDDPDAALRLGRAVHASLGLDRSADPARRAFHDALHAPYVAEPDELDAMLWPRDAAAVGV